MVSFVVQCNIFVNILYIGTACFTKINSVNKIVKYNTGADPGFQVRGGGGGGALKKIVLSGGRREIFGGISCEKSRFYAKKSYFFQF